LNQLSPTPKKILIVDDSFIMRRLIAEIVESDMVLDRSFLQLGTEK
jgi:CheY-like chemotaxis protein